MKIIGIDPSTVSLGFALIEKADTNNPKYFVSTIKAPNKATPDEKFVHIIKETIMGIRKYEPSLIVCEYPFNIQGHAKVLIEVYGAIRFYCLRTNIEFLPLPQTRLKKYATGVGKAEKSEMRMRVYKEFNLDLTDDEADAFWIAHFGMTWKYGSKVKFRQQSVDDAKKSLDKKPKRIKK